MSFDEAVSLDRPGPPTYAALFAVREFRVLWFTRGLSLLGDQLARVALSVLVFQRTDSAVLTGLVYALTYLPYLAGPLFAGLADRRSRRQIMVVVDVMRGIGLTAMALPHVPLVAMCALLVAVIAVSPLYDSARSATVPELLSPDLYPVGLGLLTVTTEAAQVLGFGVGGALVATLGARTALGVDAATFLVSAALIRWGLRDRGAAAASSAPESWRAQITAANSLVFGSPRLRGLLSLAWLNALWLVPEALAAPYASSLHRGPVAVGLLLAAIPAGCVVGSVVIARFVGQQTRVRLMTPLAMVAAAPLIGCAAHPGLVTSILLWGLCGVGTAYNVPANAAFVQQLPNHRRGQAFALVTSGMVAGQGLGALAGGALAVVVSPAAVVAGAGVVGVAVVLLLAATWLRREQMIVLPREIDLIVSDAREPATAVRR